MSFLNEAFSVMDSYRVRNYHLGIYMKNRDYNKWLKIAEIAKIAKINVKVQIFLFAFGSLHVNPRFYFLRVTSMALVHMEL